ncbi:MAG: aminodeoxychorismate synthase, component I, partial [Planctomycetota bacterium]
MTQSEFPVVRELTGFAAENVFERLADKPHCLFLDSALRDSELGRYSFVAADPYEVIQCDAVSAGARIRASLSKLSSSINRALPPFQGGVAGVMTYEFGHAFESLPRARFDEFGLPAVSVGVYDVVVAFDHDQNKAWIISQGFPESDPARRRERATSRMAQVLQWLDEPVQSERWSTPPDAAISIAAPH